MAPYPLVPLFNILAGMLVLLVLPWRVRAWNTGICSYIAWLSTLCLVTGINAVIWRDNVDDSASAWCEIAIRIFIGGSVALPACSLSIIRRLYLTTCARGSIHSRWQSKTWQIVVDFVICFGPPILVIVLAYVVQGRRYGIYEEVGCVPAIYNTPLAYVLVFVWPLVLGVISATYSFLVSRTILRQQKQLNELLSSGNPSVSYSLFYRVFALTIADALLTIPLSTISIYMNATARPIYPYVSWNHAHRNYSLIYTITMEEYNSRRNGWRAFARLWTHWIYVFSAVVFLAVFATSKGLLRFYSNKFWALARVGGLRRRPSLIDKKTSIVFTSVVEVETSEYSTELDKVREVEEHTALDVRTPDAGSGVKLPPGL